MRWLPAVTAGGLALACVLIAGCGKVEPKVPTDFPARETPNYQGLVSVSWLKGLLDYQQSGFQAPRPATYHNERFVILEASWATLERAKDYRNGHVPGAIHFNTDELENGSPRWRLRKAEELRQAIGRAGITADTTVIVFGEKLIAAARVWWALKYAGVADVRLLDGGIAAWAEAGYPVEKEIRLPQPVEFAAPVASNLLATTDYIRERLQGGHLWMADVRSVEEFTGRTSGYSYLEAKGRIPFAVHVGDGDDGAYLYKQRDGRLRPPAEILAHWQRQGIVAAKEGGRFEREVVFYCGGGWRSSVAFFYAWLLGFENIRNYSDGWSGWSTEYQADPASKGRTPGWRQQPSGNPISRRSVKPNSYQYQSVFPVRFVESKRENYVIPEVSPAPLDSTFEKLGYDLVSRSQDNGFECSPLSCNDLASEVPLNRHCLFDDAEAAFALAETLEVAGQPMRGEPGPYFVVEVWRGLVPKTITSAEP